MIVAGLWGASAGLIWALDYPATPPGKATRTLDTQQAILTNEVLKSVWRLDAGQITELTVTNKHWQPRGGIVVLRNPSDKRASCELELERDLELPDRFLTDYTLQAVRPNQRIDSLHTTAGKPLPVELLPFEVLVFETKAVTR